MGAPPACLGACLGFGRRDVADDSSSRQLCNQIQHFRVGNSTASKLWGPPVNDLGLVETVIVSAGAFWYARSRSWPRRRLSETYSFRIKICFKP